MEETRSIDGSSGTRIAFRCGMLMTKNRQDGADEPCWRCLVCEGEDDFDVLAKRRWGFFGCDDSFLWEAGDPVLLWDANEAEVPFAGGAERFQRFAEVVAAEAGGADREKPWL